MSIDWRDLTGRAEKHVSGIAVIDILADCIHSIKKVRIVNDLGKNIPERRAAYG